MATGFTRRIAVLRERQQQYVLWPTAPVQWVATKTETGIKRAKRPRRYPGACRKFWTCPGGWIHAQLAAARWRAVGHCVVLRRPRPPDATASMQDAPFFDQGSLVALTGEPGGAEIRAVADRSLPRSLASQRHQRSWFARRRRWSIFGLASHPDRLLKSPSWTFFNLAWKKTWFLSSSRTCLGWSQGRAAVATHSPPRPQASPVTWSTAVPCACQLDPARASTTQGA